METVDLVRRLYGHMEWADAVVWRAVLATEAANGDEKLRDLLHHTHLVQRAFLAMWTHTPFDPKEGVDLDLRAQAALARSGHQRIAAYIDGLRAATLDEPFVLPWSERAAARIGRAPAPSTLGETLVQVPMHTQHHRAQASKRLRELGGEPPMSDFIAWVWTGKPAPEWPE